MKTPAEAIAKLEADYEAATEGPWFQYHDEGALLPIVGHALSFGPDEDGFTVEGGMTLLEVAFSDDGNDGCSDAAHIASIHNATPALLAGMRTLMDVRGVLALSGSVGHMMLVAEIDEALTALGEAVSDA